MDDDKPVVRLGETTDNVGFVFIPRLVGMVESPIYIPRKTAVSSIANDDTFSFQDQRYLAFLLLEFPSIQCISIHTDGYAMITLDEPQTLGWPSRWRTFASALQRFDNSVPETPEEPEQELPI
jgi:hypothetical protein